MGVGVVWVAFISLVPKELYLPAIVECWKLDPDLGVDNPSPPNIATKLTPPTILLVLPASIAEPNASIILPSALLPPSPPPKITECLPGDLIILYSPPKITEL